VCSEEFLGGWIEKVARHGCLMSLLVICVWPIRISKATDRLFNAREPLESTDEAKERTKLTESLLCSS